jgi:metallo-beta-lactamase class B
MCRQFQILCIAALLALTTATHAQTPCDSTRFNDTLLDKLVGYWDLTGKIGNREVTNHFSAKWILNHQIMELHFKDTSYEALVYLGYDCEKHRYVAHWPDILGGKYSETLGYGTRTSLSTIAFHFDYPDGPFFNQFIYDAQQHSWHLHMTSGNKTWGDEYLTQPYYQAVWFQDYEPFRIAGNLYYVGSYDLACYLITTPSGHILINTGIPGSEDMIRKHMEALGFRFKDIKIVMITHGHFDHVGGVAAIKQETGAQVMIGEGDGHILADGGNSDVIMGGHGPLFEAVMADRFLRDKDSVELGGMKILVLHHPGHTKGACSYLFTVKDERRSYRVLIANMPTILDAVTFPSMKGYPDVQNDFAYTLDTMRKIQFDLWMASHANQFDLQAKRKPGDAYHPEVFGDRAGYEAALDDLRKAYLKKNTSSPPSSY